MVHVEIPFSPTRLEQRNGRIDRHGQPSPIVEIYHFVSEGFERAKPGSLDGDLDFLWRIARKVDTIRDDLGTAGPVLAQQVEEAMFGRRDTVDDGQVERAKAKASRTALKLERNLREEIKRLRDQLDESVEQLGITPSSVARVVTVALDLARQPQLKQSARHAGCYKVGALSNAWALAKVGLADPLSGNERQITFDHQVADRDRDVVLAHLQHRLVAQATRLLRAEIWKTGGEKTLHRVSAALSEDPGLQHTVAVAHARLVVTGQDGHRLHEEVISAGGAVRNGRFARLGVGEIKKATASSSAAPARAAKERALASEWKSIEDALYRSLESRAEEVTTSLDKRLSERAEFEATTSATVLNDLKRNIEAELKELEGESGRQLRLQFTSDDEGVQLDRDIAQLRQRLQEIPGEIAREQNAIRSRYSKPQFRLFPAAVTFIVPKAEGQAS
jgi:hypothetical protein